MGEAHPKRKAMVTLGHLCKKTLFLKRIVKKLLRQKSPKPIQKEKD